MRIVRVELKNIKSYREAVIDLQRGVTAIRGHNGAGKSTLLEAIGWALFDYLPYNQANFVREGETQGRVAVRFISAKDGREYEAVRRCGSGATWYVTDPETGMRYDSAADIQDFLRAQLRIDSTVALKDLFISAIGVPQGALTADFLLTPTNRKKRFDALLQVEDYRAATDKLNETVNYLKERRAIHDMTIATLERDVARLEAARAELESARAQARDLEAEGERLERESDELSGRLRVLSQAKETLARSEGEAQAAVARLESARARLATAEDLLAEAQVAAATVAEARPAHERYLRAEREQVAARLRQHDRDTLRQHEAEIEKRHTQAEASCNHTRAELGAVQRAERGIVALQSLVIRQGELERQRDEARQNSQKLRETREQASARGAELAGLEQAISEREREVVAIEASRSEAKALPERRRAVETLQAAVAVRKQREARRTAIGAERQEVAGRRESAAREATKMAENVDKLELVRELVAQQAEFEERERTAQAAVDMANARLQQTRLSREQAGAGNCPFLAEPCLNIQRRGENNLRAYFDKRVADEERALAPLKERLTEASKQAEDVRRKALGFTRLDEFRERLQRARALLAECDATDTRLNAEDAEIAADLKRAGDNVGLAQAQRALQASEDADRKLATLAPLQRDLTEKRAQREQLVAERARLAWTAATLADSPATLQAVERNLKELNDPRGRATGLAERAEERPKLEEALAGLELTLAELATERAGVAESLAPFTNLDAELAALEQELKQTRDDHLLFIQHERSAAQAPARAQERDAAAAAHVTAERVSAIAQQSLESARAGFDASELAHVNDRTQEVSVARGENRQQLHSARETITAREEELQRGQSQVNALEAARVEAEELVATETTLQQFRGLIKDAGPQVTRALLSQISQQANTIFGDIIGDRASTLSWENDYEIVLRRDGKMRSFAQLSGGEQMSAALAVRLALLRRLTRLDMAFFDEPTQNMDGERRSALAEQLRRVRGFEQLIVISHDDTFEQGLDSVIHLEKRDGATCVAEGEEVFAANTDTSLEENLSAFAFG